MTDVVLLSHRNVVDFPITCCRVCDTRVLLLTSIELINPWAVA